MDPKIDDSPTNCLYTHSWASLKLTIMLAYLLNAMLLSKIRLSSGIDSN